MTDDANARCENEDCDKCDPRPRWNVSKHRIQHITYKREIKAATSQEALQIFEAGTAWPSSYDDHYGEIVQEDNMVAVLVVDEDKLKYYREENCWNTDKHKALTNEFLTRGTGDDEFAAADPVDIDSTKEFTK